MTSIIYKHPKIYELVMRGLHRQGYAKRYKLIAKEIGNLEVLDLCCGDCKLAEYLGDKRKYTGADFNDVFVRNARKKGLKSLKIDLTKDDIPESECIVLQASLYQFIPNQRVIVKKLLGKGKKVIISESYINMAQSRNKLIAWLGNKFTQTNKTHSERFDEKKIIELYKEFKAKKIIYSSREIIGVFGE